MAALCVYYFKLMRPDELFLLHFFISQIRHVCAQEFNTGIRQVKLKIVVHKLENAVMALNLKPLFQRINVKRAALCIQNHRILKIFLLDATSSHSPGNCHTNSQLESNGHNCEFLDNTLGGP